ncbi:hypothetical protein ACH5RR_005344 [Cinchona calisaya]|uniref:Uncharacterized protein n=1 Tax=Cinchona calisaya TaxID=153742 RepID=A0ABD3AKX0_9GENT
MEKNREEADNVWSPVAAAEDIQKRLLRPSSSAFLASQRRDRIISQIPSPFHENSYELLKKNKRKIPKLEDYLDPVLLSTIRAKVISSKRRKNYGNGAEIENKSTSIGSYDCEFDWPQNHHELKVSTATTTEKSIVR